MGFFKSATLVYEYPSSVTECGTGAGVQSLDRCDAEPVCSAEHGSKDPRPGPRNAAGESAPSPRRNGKSGELFSVLLTAFLLELYPPRIDFCAVAGEWKGGRA